MACAWIADDIAREAVAFEDGLGAALGTATGFSEDDLVDGTLERYWQSSASDTGHNIAIELPSDAWDSVAVFDVRASDGTAPSSVTLHVGSDLVSWSSGEAITVNDRGDGWIKTGETPTKYIMISVAFGSAKTCRVGAIVAGVKSEATRTFAERTDTRSVPVVENVSRGGTRTRARLGAHARTISMNWDALTEAQHDTVLALLDIAHEPLVLLPDDGDADETYYGLVDAAYTVEIDDPLRYEVSVRFAEHGRAV